MKRVIFTLLLLVLILGMAMPTVLAQENESDECIGVALMDGWARPSIPGASNSAGYGKLVNLGDEDDSLVAASSSVAEIVELHEMIITEEEVMRMQPREGGFFVPAGDFATLQPGGWHIMLIDVIGTLEVGDIVDLTLEFEQGGVQEISIPVLDPDTVGMSQDAEASMMGAASSPEVIVPGCEGVQILGAYVRPSVIDGGNTAAYALLANPSETDDTLLSVSIAPEVTEVVELHNTIIVDEQMQMRPVDGGMTVPAGQVTFLQPGGLHIMLIDVQDMLEVGDTVDMIFSFENAGTIPMRVPVQPPPGEMMSMGSMNMGNGHGMDESSDDMDMGESEETDEDMSDMDMDETDGTDTGDGDMGTEEAEGTDEDMGDMDMDETGDGEAGDADGTDEEADSTDG